jgi:hypothetical protein
VHFLVVFLTRLGKSPYLLRICFFVFLGTSFSLKEETNADASCRHDSSELLTSENN